MGNRGLLALAAVVAVVAVGGIGFAAFTANAYVNGTAQAGTLNLYWSNLGETSASSSYVSCSDYITTLTTTSDTLNVSASNLAPGDYCTFSGDLNNGGSIPAVTYDQLSSVTGSGCNWFAVDNFGGHSYPPIESPLGPITITSGSPLAYSLEMGLSSGQGNGCQGANLGITLTFSATAGS